MEKYSYEEREGKYFVERFMTEREIESQIELLIDDAGFQPHRFKRSTELSGGWKRKLCCVNAFAGRPQLIVLDEPSSGMDPINRRLTWDFILKRKA